MSITDYALKPQQVAATKGRPAGPRSLATFLFTASVATTIVAKIIGG